jgi:hypothetical protein
VTLSLSNGSKEGLGEVIYKSAKPRLTPGFSFSAACAIIAFAKEATMLTVKRDWVWFLFFLIAWPLDLQAEPKRTIPFWTIRTGDSVHLHLHLDMSGLQMKALRFELRRKFDTEATVNQGRNGTEISFRGDQKTVEKVLGICRSWFNAKLQQIPAPPVINHNTARDLPSRAVLFYTTAKKTL